MFFDQALTGDSLASKTLSLTYDDGPGDTPGTGPGPRTLEIAEFLFEHNVQATFFVVGSHVQKFLGALTRLKELGHLVGNHTYSHPNLFHLVACGCNPVDEVAAADLVIREHVADNAFLFRAPYGAWKEPSQSRSPLALALNESRELRQYTGPIHWDIDSLDWRYWHARRTVTECAKNVITLVESRGRGIVLFHDGAKEESLRAKNQTCDLTKLIVPILKEKGYRFVRLDKVPQIATALGR